jgi:hypothetical protein
LPSLEKLARMHFFAAAARSGNTAKAIPWYAVSTRLVKVPV